MLTIVIIHYWDFVNHNRVHNSSEQQTSSKHCPIRKYTAHASRKQYYGTIDTMNSTSKSTVARTAVIVALCIPIGIVIYTITQNTQNTTKPEPITTTEEIEAPADQNTGKTNTPATAGTYTPYTGNNQLAEKARNGNTVLFFHAAWCPTCRSLDKDIRENLQSIPENTTLVKVDYDTQTDLRKKYGVTYQHTLVQVNEQLEPIHKWFGSRGLKGTVEQIR